MSNKISKTLQNLPKSEQDTLFEEFERLLEDEPHKTKPVLSEESKTIKRILRLDEYKNKTFFSVRDFQSIGRTNRPSGPNKVNVMGQKRILPNSDK